MKFIYPAVFHKTENGTFQATFPDLVCCYAEGDTLDEAIEKANEAAYDWISLELSEDDADLPPVSDESDITLSEGDVVRNISVNIRFYEGWDE
ncbi:MAG: type II toxin-antitoxin system HicB family antitoxin [Eubacteriales bacterium]|nr:type II toxin-antitoxin system HicB family antitoxin [Eubacteriales bacterium]